MTTESAIAPARAPGDDAPDPATRTNVPASTPPAWRAPYLDGVRGLAAVYVAYSHLWAMYLGTFPWPQGLLVNWAGYGHLAVDVFIVLSGFCLMLPVARAGRLEGGAAGFLRRRAWRILPPYFAAVVVGMVVAGAIDRWGRGGDGPLLTARSVAVNALMLQDVLPSGNTVNAPLWSVAVETKIYLLFPPLVILWCRYGWGVALAAAAVVTAAATAVGATVWSVPAMAKACPWYLLLFAGGAAAGWAAVARPDDRARWRPRAITAASLAAAAASLAAWGMDPVAGAAAMERWLPVIDVAVGSFAAAALYLIGRSPDGVWAMLRRPLSARPLVAVGHAAYSLYLVHLPALYCARIVARRLPGAAAASPVECLAWTALIGVPLVAVATFAFYRCVEWPTLRLRATLGRRPSADPAAGAALSTPAAS